MKLSSVISAVRHCAVCSISNILYTNPKKEFILLEVWLAYGLIVGGFMHTAKWVAYVNFIMKFLLNECLVGKHFKCDFKLSGILCLPLWFISSIKCTFSDKLNLKSLWCININASCKLEFCPKPLYCSENYK